MNQSKINAGSINQKSVQAVSTAISNSININAQSINSQCTEHQHAKHSVFISKAPSVSVQCTLRQQPLNATLTSMRSSSTSMLRVSTASVQNINNQRTQFQQPMCSASTANTHITRFPYAWFLQPEYFHSSQYASHLCHSARSRRRSRRIHPPRKYPLPGCVG